MLSVKKQRMCLLALDFVLMSSIFVGVAGGFHATKTKEQDTIITNAQKQTVNIDEAISNRHRRDGRTCCRNIHERAGA